MNAHKNIVVRLLIAAIVLVGFSGSRCLADLYSGTLTWDAGENEIVAYDGWDSAFTSISWSVTRDEGDPWTYSYTFTSPAGGHGLSHLIIQVSDAVVGGLGAFSLDNALDFINTQGYNTGETDPEVELQDFQPSDPINTKPNPFMPDNIYGIKFQDFFSEPGDGVFDGAGNLVGQSWTVTFDSWRNPMSGDFYAVNGAGDTSDPWAAAYNSGFGSLNGCNIAVPDTSYVPVPGAFLLGILGFGATGMKLRKYA